MDWNTFFEEEKKLVYFNDLTNFIEGEYKTKIIYPKKNYVK